MGDDGEGGVDNAFEFGAITSQTIYHKLHFNNPDSLYDKPAPDVVVTLSIGAALVLVMVTMWCYRYHEKRHAIPADKMTYWMSVRAMISAAIDNDDPRYTIVKITAQSIVFLAGIQVDYHTAFFVMIIFFTLESSLDTFRTLLVVAEHDGHDDLVSTSSRMAQDLTKAGKGELHPTNVYEDLSRVKYVVVMVFITQFLLISFVVIDILNSSTHACPDGTPGCPVAGTLGSWCLYCLGIFMAGVVLLGPKTNFGESEQNPAFWMQLFLYLKENRGRVQWTDAKTGHEESLDLRPNDWRVWTRFVMSFIINGIGFHILVFALPIQIAAQSSLTGVVFRAVGMLYLVDLDDSPGYTLSFVYRDSKKMQGNHNDDDDKDPDEATKLLKQPNLAKEAQSIIKEARDKLDALAASSGL